MQNGRVHFIGVGGIGMSALAQAIRAAGQPVSGSDREWRGAGGTGHAVLDGLAGAGMALYPQDGSGVGDDVAEVVVSTAIEAGNPDTERARARGLPVVHRAQLLARYLEGRRGIAVAGTSGKTTVTAMVGHLLRAAGWSPSIVNGGLLLGIPVDGVANFVPGASAWCVFEADESDRSLTAYRPEHAIVTNVSADHFSAAEGEALFEQFCRRIPGQIVTWRDSAPLLERCEGASGREGSAFTFRDVRFRMLLPGSHNIENALQALLLCERLGLAPADLVAPLAAFAGVHRRLECAGERGGVPVYDDYAHNPAKIRAVLETLRPAEGRLFAAWRPHGFGPLDVMFEGLVAVLRDVLRPQDSVLVRPVYYAGGTASPRRSAADLAAALRAAGVAAVETDDGEPALRRWLAGAVRGDVVASLGARDPGLPAFARLLVDALP